MRSFGLIFLLLTTGCMTSPDYYRINPYDPKSPVFGAMFSEPKITSTAAKNITLSWVNQSQYSDGFLVSKKLNDKFSTLDTLRNNTTYTDTTKQFSLDMKYRVTSFIENKNSIEEKYNYTIDVDFGEIKNIYVYPSQNSLVLQWYSSNFLQDLIVIEYKENQNQKWNEVYREEGPDNFKNRVELDLSQNKQYLFRIKLFLKNHKGNFQKFAEAETTLE